MEEDPIEDCSQGGERDRVNPRGESQDSAGEDSAGESIPDEVLRAVAEVDRSPGSLSQSSSTSTRGTSLSDACRLQPKSRTSGRRLQEGCYSATLKKKRPKRKLQRPGQPVPCTVARCACSLRRRWCCESQSSLSPPCPGAESGKEEPRS